MDLRILRTSAAEVANQLKSQLKPLIAKNRTEKNKIEGEMLIDSWWKQVQDWWNDHITETNEWNKEVVKAYQEGNLPADLMESILMKPLRSHSKSTATTIKSLFLNTRLTKDEREEFILEILSLPLDKFI